MSGVNTSNVLRENCAERIKFHNVYPYVGLPCSILYAGDIVGLKEEICCP